MAWIVLFLILGLLGLVGLALTIFGSSESNGSGGPSAKAVGITMVSIAILAQLLFFGLFSIKIVDAREVGVVKTFGRITNQRSSGLAIIAPWQTMNNWNIRETYVYSDTRCKNGWEQCLEAASRDSQVVYVQPKLNIKVSQVDVQGLAREVGTAYVERVVRPLMKTVTKNITVDYEATEILQKRAEIERRVAEQMSKELQLYSITVTRMSFENLDFSDEFNAQIEAKVAEAQRALLELNKVEVVKNQAAQVIAEAQGKAEANRILSASITSNLLQWEAIQKLNDNINIALIPSGQGIILDPATLLAPRP